MFSRHMKRDLTLVIIRKKQSAVRSHLTPVRITGTKRQKKTNVGEDVKKGGFWAQLVEM